MPRVTTEKAKELINAGCYPPRHQRGCPKNLARTTPLIYAAQGLSVGEVKDKVYEAYNNLSCTCK